MIHLTLKDPNRQHDTFQDDDLSLGEAILDLEHVEAECEQYYQRELHAPEQLAALRDAITDAERPGQLAPIFSRDPGFIAQFGDDPEQWVEKINSYLKHEISSEGQKIQDYMTWGMFLGPFAVLFGKWMRSMSRVEKVLRKNVRKIDDKSLRRESIYLPDADEAVPLIEGLQKLQGLVIKIAEDPTKLDSEAIGTELKKLGIDVGKNPISSTDWRSVAGGVFARWLVQALIPGAGFLISVTSTHAGAVLSSKQGKQIRKRGWTVENLTKACQDFLELVENNQEVLKTMKSVKSLKEDELPVEQQEELQKVQFMFKACIKGYKKMMATLGRGLAQATAMSR